MERVSIDAVDPSPTDDHRSHDRRVLTGPLGTSDVAVVHYALDPGERFSGSVHAHTDQEEVFLVLEGEATFETEDGAVVVGENEAIRFGPGEFQTGWNDTDRRVEALALGAPRDTEDVRLSRIVGYGNVSCPECGNDHMQVDPSAEDSELVCPECGAAWN